MIDVVKRTPKIYRDESRDFQVLARLYSAIFNLSKMYADDLKVWDPNIDNKLITLRSRTINFINRHQWDLNDLEAISSCFKYLMRNKGTEFALEACINILMKSRGINTGANVNSVVLDKSGCINIWIVNDKVLNGILEDLIRYLIPTGLIYRIYNYDLEVLNAANNIITDIYYREDYIVKTIGEEEVSSEGAVPDSLKVKFEDILYPFTPAMLINNFKGNYFYNIEPTSKNFGYYGPYITNTFVYNDSEGWMAIKGKFRRPFTLFVQGYTLYCYPETEENGDIIAPVITFNSDDRSLNFQGYAPMYPHNPREVVFDVPHNNSEGTLVWNEWD